MKKCPACGHESDRSGMNCPVCGAYYSKIIQLIDEEERNEERSSFRGRCRRILKSGNVRQKLAHELKSAYANLPPRAKFSLLVIGMFVFALIVSVL